METALYRIETATDVYEFSTDCSVFYFFFFNYIFLSQNRMDNGDVWPWCAAESHSSTLPEFFYLFTYFIGLPNTVLLHFRWKDLIFPIGTFI